MKARTLQYTFLLLILVTAAIAANYRYIEKNVTAQLVPYSHVAAFTKVYDTKHWGKGSGAGSDPQAAKPYIALLQNYITDPRFHKIVDLGCGDWQIMNKINIPSDKEYYGYDVVPSIIATNQANHTAANVHFTQVTSLRDFKAKNITGDLLIVKDVLQHWPDAEIKYFLQNILPDFKYALITNAYKVTSQRQNINIELGHFRPLDLQGAPYNLQNVKPLLEYAGPDNKLVLFYTNPKFDS